MGEVTIAVNSRNYAVACDEGQEARLRRLGKYLDQHIAKLADEVGQIGDLRLLLMAGLVLADELTEARTRIARLEKKIEAGVRAATPREQLDAEARTAIAVDKAAARIEAATQKLGGLAAAE